jgi:hypothetical protein
VLKKALHSLIPIITPIETQVYNSFETPIEPPS